jgi:arginine exporter protein ArgO
MGWAVIGIIIAGFAIPRLGKVLLWIGALGAVLLVVCGVVLYEMNRRQEAEQARSMTLIKPTEIELSDMLLNPNDGSDSFTLVGRVKNLSQRFTLTSFGLMLTMRDCDSNGCETVGEERASFYETFLQVKSARSATL